MSSSASLTSGVAGRYATALFEIARESRSLDKVEADLAALQQALADSPDLRAAIASPVFSRQDLDGVVQALASRMALGPEVANTLRLMAHNRRLFVLPALIAQVKALAADARGEVTAAVTAATPLSDDQLASLRAALKAGIGKDVALDITIDPALIGGLVVRVGSRMIDTSIRSKLANLQNVMKEVG
ncbi:MAG: F0F1 ATP synthase subunit delta [Amaricoccus sp.]